MVENSNESEPRWLKRLKNHPVIAVLIAVVAVVTGLASFTDSIEKLSHFIGSSSNEVVSVPEKVVETKSEADLAFEKSIIGSWLCSATLPVPAGSKVIELKNIFMTGGVYNSRGRYRYGFGEYPIMVSGTWNIHDSRLNFRVTSSNVPLAIQEGYQSYTQLVSIEDGRMVYIDSADGQTKIDYKVD